jgi:hypothetical protein
MLSPLFDDIELSAMFLWIYFLLVKAKLQATTGQESENYFYNVEYFDALASVS